MRRKRLIRLLVILLAASCAGAVSAADWTQFGYDATHAGFNRAEAGYPTPSGNVVVPAYAGGKALAHQTDSAPVYLSNVSTAGGTRDMLYILALDGTLMAYDAKTATQVWSQQPTVAPGSNPALAQGGSTGSPAIDPGRQYVYAYGLDGNVHKYQVGDGTEIMTGGWPETSTIKPDQEKGAAGMAIAVTPSGTFLYSVSNGYDGDGGDYQGHLTTINLASGAQTVFNSLCSNLTIHFVKNGVTSGAGQNDCGSRQSGIWGRPGAIYDPGTNRLFISTANGPYNANSGGMNWADSVLALNPDGTGAGGGMPIDSYTPTTYANLQGTDADLGSVSIALVPAPAGTAAAYQHLGVQAGKDGCVRLINLANMSGASAPAHTGGELSALNLPGGSHCSTGADGPEIKPQPAVWVDPVDGSSWIYVTSYGNGSAAYKILLDGSGVPSLSQQWTSTSGTSPVVANGVVYYINGSARIVGFDARTGASLWTSAALGGVHWQSLILLNGHIYTVDTTSKLWAFQLDGVFRGGFE